VHDAPAAPAGPSDDLFPRTRTRADDLDEPDEDEDDEPRGPSYTWLHYLVLVAVAFVLGLLVWELVSRDDPGITTDEASAAVVVTDTVAARGGVGHLDSGR